MTHEQEQIPSIILTDDENSTTEKPKFRPHFFRSRRTERAATTDKTLLLEKLRSTSSSPPPPTIIETSTIETTTDEPTPPISTATLYPGYQRQKSHSVKLNRHSDGMSNVKKAVRFADDFGLDLSQIKLIKSDEIPSIPCNVFDNLHLTPQRTKLLIFLQAEFDNPMHCFNFNERLSTNKIVLEQSNAIDHRLYGTIKLISLCLHKRVRIRLTTNQWHTSTDYDAVYIPNSHDGIYDRFSFTIELDPMVMIPGNLIEFCLNYDSLTGQEYWDNNFFQNYRFRCCSRSIPDFSD